MILNGMALTRSSLPQTEWRQTAELSSKRFELSSCCISFDKRASLASGQLCRVLRLVQLFRTKRTTYPISRPWQKFLPPMDRWNKLSKSFEQICCFSKRCFSLSLLKYSLIQHQADNNWGISCLQAIAVLVLLNFCYPQLHIGWSLIIGESLDKQTNPIH